MFHIRALWLSELKNVKTNHRKKLYNLARIQDLPMEYTKEGTIKILPQLDESVEYVLSTLNKHPHYTNLGKFDDKAVAAEANMLI